MDHTCSKKTPLTKFITPANVRPIKSPTLNRRKQYTGKKYFTVKKTQEQPYTMQQNTVKISKEKFNSANELHNGNIIDGQEYFSVLRLRTGSWQNPLNRQ